MEFQACYRLLAERPPHAHEHCEHHVPEAEMQAVADAVASSLSLGGNEAPARDPCPADPMSTITTTPPATIPTTHPAELLRAFFGFQEQRARIYGEFQDGFEKFKATAAFQPFCTEITAQFAAVSQQVNAIEAALRSHQRTHGLATLLRRVQEQEKDKLMLTSALLVEQMRLLDMQGRPEPDLSIVALLERSIMTMNLQHTEIVMKINELIDEIRMELVDMEEAEGGAEQTPMQA